MSSPREDHRTQYENDIKEFYDVEIDGNNSYDDEGELFEEGNNSYDGQFYSNEE